MLLGDADTLGASLGSVLGRKELLGNALGLNEGEPNMRSQLAAVDAVSKTLIETVPSMESH